MTLFERFQTPDVRQAWRFPAIRLTNILMIAILVMVLLNINVSRAQSSAITGYVPKAKGPSQTIELTTSLTDQRNAKLNRLALTDDIGGSKPQGSAANLNRELSDFAASYKAIVGVGDGPFARLKLLAQPLPDIEELNIRYTKLKANHLLYLAHFAKVKRKLEKIQARAIYFERLQLVESKYRRVSEPVFEYFDALFNSTGEIDNNTDGQNQLSIIESVTAKWDLGSGQSILSNFQDIVGANNSTILRLNDLPYQSLSLATRNPLLEPTITPSYSSTTEILAEPQDTRTDNISKAVLDLASELKHDPIRIYQYVQEQIDTQWYDGSMKGAEETLKQGAANSTDQSSLLIQLFRASNIPARFVDGVIEIEAGQLANWVGSVDVNQAVIALRRAGIPNEVVVRGGKIAAVHMQHTWVSALIPYSNYRGATVDAGGLRGCL